MSDYGEQAETAFRYFAIEGGSDDPGAQHDDASDSFKPDPTPEPLTAEEIARTRADLARLLSGDAIPAGIAQRLLATLDAARGRPGLDVDDCSSILTALAHYPTWFDETAQKVARIRRDLGGT